MATTLGIEIEVLERQRVITNGPGTQQGVAEPAWRLDLTASRPFLLTALSFFVFPVS